MTTDVSFSSENPPINPAAPHGLIKPSDMPLLSAASSLPVLAALFSIPMIAVVIKHPAADDAYSIIGALLAAIVSLIDARKKDKELGHTVAVFLVSAFIGMSAPGLVYHGMIWKGWIQPLEVSVWQLWAMAGFACGTAGWGIFAAFRRFAMKWTRKQEQELLARYVGPDGKPLHKEVKSDY